LGRGRHKGALGRDDRGWRREGGRSLVGALPLVKLAGGG